MFVSRHGRRSTSILATAVLTALALSACGGSDEDAGPTIEGAWARTSPTAATVGAVYAEVSVASDDRLMSATVGSEIAARAEIHEMVVVHDDADHDDADHADHADHEDGMTHDDMSEMPMQMQEVADGIAVEAGTPLVLEPGGYHIMLIDLAHPLEAGATVPVMLTFENAGDVTVEVPVRDTAP